jgi:hypothetical protein
MASEMRWQTAWMRSQSNPLLFVTDCFGSCSPAKTAKSLSLRTPRTSCAIPSGRRSRSGTDSFQRRSGPGSTFRQSA